MRYLRRLRFVVMCLFVFPIFVGCFSGMPETINGMNGDIAYVSSRPDIYSDGLDALWQQLNGQTRHLPSIFGSLYTQKIDSHIWHPIAGTFPSIPMPLAFSPDGKQLAYGMLSQSVVPSETGRITVSALDALGNIQQICFECTTPAWSFDGKYMTVYKYGDHKNQLSKIDMATLRETPLTDVFVKAKPESGFWFDAYRLRSSWSPDGKWIVYEDIGENSKWQLNIVDSDGTSTAMITDGQQPNWSVDGNKIVFVREGDIWLYNFNSGSETLLIDDPISAEWPVWSQLGDKLVFVSLRDGNRDIYYTKVDRIDPINVTDAVSEDFYPTWHTK